MKTIKVQLAERSYPIYVGADNLGRSDLLVNHIKSKQVILVTNETIAPLYLNKIKVHLDNHQLEVVILPDGEQYKTLDIVGQVFDAAMARKFSRNATLIALGGGVIGDISGFAAACYQRGIPFIQIPTTLLAQVDSSVGGKTGVNHRLGKNMIGAFYQPQSVIIDINVLNTLDDRQFSAGIAEVIKYGLIRDISFFVWLEKNIEKILARDQESLIYIIEKSCQAKAEIVASDERESGIRAILNLGHTFGHAIETGMGYGHYLHGEAVSIGTCQAADLSKRLGYLNDTDVDRIIAIFEKAKLPIKPPCELSAEDFLRLMAVDKKNLDGDIRVILLHQIGRASLPTGVDKKILLETLNKYGRG